MSWIKERLEEKQIVLEQEWLRDLNAVERHPARNVDEAWDHMVAALERDIHEFNSLKLCGHRQVDVIAGRDSLKVHWQDEQEALLTVSMDRAGEMISYAARSGKEGKERTGVLRVRPRRGTNAILYDGRPTPFTFEEASQFLLQPLLMP
ncbi:MAG TPA: hypothetical protein VMT53_14890 [Terriglobales bacterium]|nr:hypothetical protein [Terriglobales bacterium]